MRTVRPAHKFPTGQTALSACPEEPATEIISMIELHPAVYGGSSDNAFQAQVTCRGPLASADIFLSRISRSASWCGSQLAQRSSFASGSRIHSGQLPQEGAWTASYAAVLAFAELTAPVSRRATVSSSADAFVASRLPAASSAIR